MTYEFPFLKTIQDSSQSLAIGGLWGSSRAYALSLLRQYSAVPSLIITTSQKQAEELYEDVIFFQQNTRIGEVFLYSQWDIAPYELVSPHREIVSERLAVLDKLLNHENIVVVAPIQAVMHRTLPRKALRDFPLYLGIGEELDRQKLLAMLVDTGYKHTALVENRGEFSGRASIASIIDFSAFSTSKINSLIFLEEISCIFSSWIFLIVLNNLL